uniref:Putative hydrolase enzyme n=1 Tax=viral metagenome TaxID=1070528 RepID=A0A6M3JQC8_9ZZZZ
MKGRKRTELIIIDPQNDFCNSKGSLFVPGATEDMDRVAEMINRIGKDLFDIHVTLDSHHYVDIAHPIFWIDGSGKHPNPFTIISAKDVEDGKWHAANPQFFGRSLEYVQKLDQNDRYLLCIWPPHCLIGSWGYSVHKPLYTALLRWEEDFAMVDYVTKGSNFWTEHYSAVQADVPDPQDPGTQLNARLIETLEEADEILITGEALSHCVANTITDIANNFGDDNISKFTLLTDASSNVSGFEDLGKKFVNDMTKRGMMVSKTTDINL